MSAERDERLVLGDVLQAAGDPLGELIAVNAARERLPDDRTLRARESAIVGENETKWFGPRAAEERRRGHVTYGWKLGELDSVTFRTTAYNFISDVVSAPMGKTLRRVRLDFRDAEHGEWAEGAFLALKLVHLEELEIRPHARMRNLFTTIREQGPLWRKLRRLDVWCTANESFDRFQGLLSGKVWPHLEHLAIHRLPSYSEAILYQIGRSKLLPRLRSLDVSHGHARSLTELDRFRHLEKLNLEHNLIAPDEARIITDALGARVEIGPQYPMANDAMLRARFASVMRRVDEQALTDERAALETVRTELAVVDAIPFLINQLDAQWKRWTLAAFEHLGTSAGPNVSDALTRRKLYSTLAHVDPERSDAVLHLRSA